MDSSSNAVIELFPDIKVIICGGHARRAHKKQLEKLSKIKQISPTLVSMYRERFPSVDDVVCYCSRHDVGVLATTSLKALARHARDIHEWDHGRCDFTCLECAVVESVRMKRT